MNADNAGQTPQDQLGSTAKASQIAGDSKLAAEAHAELWRSTRKPEAGAALLRCLRHQERHTEALPLADELNRLFPNSRVCRRQVLKAWLQGRFIRHDPDCPLEKLDACAKALLKSRLKWAWPLVRLAVMEEAVRARQWDLVKTRATQSDPPQLREARRPERDGGLSPQASWYDCLVKMLLETGRAADALVLLHRMPEPPPPERDRFLQHKLDAYLMLDSPHDALAIYAEFSRRTPPPRWAFANAARLLRDLGQTRVAIILFCRALLHTGEPGQTGMIMIDLSDLMIRIGWTDLALKQLRIALRQFRDNGWTVPPRLYALQAAAEANCIDPGRDYAHNPNTARDCLETWSREASRRIELKRDADHTRRVLTEVHGVLRAEPDGWTALAPAGLRAICSEADLPAGAESGSLITFDAVPAFDRVHTHETSRATNIRLAQPSASA
jgi:tetratricopeptide (TPR) repeat protein